MVIHATAGNLAPFGLLPTIVRLRAWAWEVCSRGTQGAPRCAMTARRSSSLNPGQ